MLKLLLIRHGESTGNRDRRMSHDQSALTAAGRQQCQQLATWLSAQGPPSHLYSSPLRRALESLEIVLQPWRWHLPSDLVMTTPVRPGEQTLNATMLPVSLSPSGLEAVPPLSLCAHLQEFHAGILAGLTWLEAKRRYPQLCHALEMTQDWIPIPGAETPAQGRQHAQAFFDHLLRQHRNGDTVWVMSHQWRLEHLVAALLGSDRTWQIPMANTALFEFWLDRDRWDHTDMAPHISDFWQIRYFNATPHFDSEIDLF